MALYIHTTEAISPLDTFRAEVLPEVPANPDGEFFTCLHPDYKELLQPSALRRMSPVIRMGLASALSCLEKAGSPDPGAIIVGSGLGCVRDTVKFLDQVVDQEEQLLNPTAFIQSTHNTVSGQIALTLGCRQYNLTFSQKSLSFETALLDALLISGEDPGRMVLLGGLDEITPESHRMLLEGGCLEGTMAGEGAGFFLVSGTPGKRDPARIEDLGIVHGCGVERVEQALNEFLEKNGCEPGRIGLVVSGRNGDARTIEGYRKAEDLFPAATVAGFKHLCGEYHTASALGLHLAVQMMGEKKVPEIYRIRQGATPGFSRVLLVNLTRDNELSMILLSA